jgi:hypothetical protein
MKIAAQNVNGIATSEKITSHRFHATQTVFNAIPTKNKPHPAAGKGATVCCSRSTAPTHFLS